VQTLAGTEWDSNPRFIALDPSMLTIAQSTLLYSLLIFYLNYMLLEFRLYKAIFEINLYSLGLPNEIISQLYRCNIHYYRNI